MTKSVLHLKALALLRNRDSALKWCNTSNRALAWKTPTEAIDPEEGGLMVVSLILRLEHGVYS
ncbi:MbcA/ParS/Xre antitoxin family protein [Enterobacter cloacae]|uniref:MbcA/ParS/Xre antitoxin family protein n=1 Tax=Enterobacter cloacae TaxID=550 RepID=UPI001F2F7EC9|nr:MbcA/ParS/Xre antitoxin family protein [Enterobacter cloacae]